MPAVNVESQNGELDTAYVEYCQHMADFFQIPLETFMANSSSNHKERWAKDRERITALIAAGLIDEVFGRL